MSIALDNVCLSWRPAYLPGILDSQSAGNCLEILIDDFIDGSSSLGILDSLSKKFKLIFHSVSLNLLHPDGPDQSHLDRYKELIDRYHPRSVSDHLCWTQNGRIHHHDLLPYPRTDETLKIATRNIESIQQAFDRKITIENITSYLEFDSTYHEFEFMDALCNTTGCKVLFDLTNFYINHTNQSNKTQSLETELKQYLSLPIDYVHLAGHSRFGDFLLDSHDASISHPVMDCLPLVNKHLSQDSFVMIERDVNIPNFSKMLEELQLVRSRMV